MRLARLEFVCVTSGTVIRPLHMLLIPPWKATLNIVFFASLKIFVFTTQVQRSRDDLNNIFQTSPSRSTTLVVSQRHSG